MAEKCVNCNCEWFRITKHNFYCKSCGDELKDNRVIALEKRLSYFRSFKDGWYKQADEIESLESQLKDANEIIKGIDREGCYDSFEVVTQDYINKYNL